MKRLLFALLAPQLAGSAYAALAMLVSQRQGMSVTGQPIWICTYSYAGSYFDRVYPQTMNCPTSLDVY